MVTTDGEDVWTYQNITPEEAQQHGREQLLRVSRNRGEDQPREGQAMTKARDPIAVEIALFIIALGHTGMTATQITEELADRFVAGMHKDMVEEQLGQAFAIGDEVARAAVQIVQKYSGERAN
jgi:hypothetical protein